jgi:hypothetical protein
MIRPFSVFAKRRALFSEVAHSLRCKPSDWHVAIDAALEHVSGLRVYPHGLITWEQVTIRPYLFQKRRFKRLYRSIVYCRTLRWFLESRIKRAESNIGEGSQPTPDPPSLA